MEAFLVRINSKRSLSRRFLEFQNKNNKPDSISKAVAASINQIPHSTDQIVSQDKANEVVNENEVLFRVVLQKHMYHRYALHC